MIYEISVNNVIFVRKSGLSEIGRTLLKPKYKIWATLFDNNQIHSSSDIVTGLRIPIWH